MKQVAKRDINKFAGLKMRNFRRELGMEQSGLAKKLGMTSGSYSKIEAGLTDVNYSRLAQIASVLGVRIIDLLCDHPESENWNARRLQIIREQFREKVEIIQLLNQQIVQLFDEVHRS